jgi:hypothetical protein
MSRPVSALSPRDREPGTNPANRSFQHGQYRGEDSSASESQLADLVGMDAGELSIERLIPDNARVMDLLRSSKYEDIDIRRITEILWSR